MSYPGMRVFSSSELYGHYNPAPATVKVGTEVWVIKSTSGGVTEYEPPLPSSQLAFDLIAYKILNRQSQVTDRDTRAIAKIGVYSVEQARGFLNPEREKEIGEKYFRQSPKAPAVVSPVVANLPKETRGIIQEPSKAKLASAKIAELEANIQYLEIQKLIQLVNRRNKARQLLHGIKDHIKIRGKA